MPKLCPHCKTSTSFKGYIQKQAVISMADETPNITKENKDSSLVITQCADCDVAVKASELLDANYCSECNELIPVSDLEDNAEGKPVCVACLVAGERSDLMDLSQAQLIRKLLELEKQVKGASQ